MNTRTLLQRWDGQVVCLKLFSECAFFVTSFSCDWGQGRKNGSNVLMPNPGALPCHYVIIACALRFGTILKRSQHLQEGWTSPFPAFILQELGLFCVEWGAPLSYLLSAKQPGLSSNLSCRASSHGR